MRYFVLLIIALLLSSCTSRNEHYYRTHPQALQNDIKKCPIQKPASISCEKLASIAGRMNELAYQLQISPQGFGKKILALQEILARQNTQLKNNPSTDLRNNIKNNEQQLAEYLAVVRWLESPES